MEKGRFRLDDPVNRLLENVKIQTKFKKQPTVRNLLSHTSGFPVHADPVCFSLNEAVSLEEMIEKSAITVMPPNQEIAYSNTAFNIIGYLVGQFADEPYPTYMKKNVFDPLDMNSSSFEQSPEIRRRMAQPYSRNKPEDPIEKVNPWYGGSNPEKPCGSLFSSVTDLSHFLIAQMNMGLYNGKRILKDSTVREMQKLQAPAGRSRSGYAISWKHTWHYGNLLLSHTGGNLGWTAHVAFYPKLKVGIIILCNLNDNSGWRPPAREALHLLTGGTISFNPQAGSTKLTSQQRRKLVGIYAREFQKAEIKLEENALVIERGSEKACLERLDKARYLVHGGGSDELELTFEFDSRGTVRQFDLDTEVFQRYVEDKRLVDTKADLRGVWRGEYVHPYGYFTMDLIIKDPVSVSATDMLGNVVQISDFKSDQGRISGTTKFKIPPDYVGWGAEEFDVTLNLACIERKLDGYMSLKSRIGESKARLILARAS
jgi:CubicO group peptidase (beta-lactamase class C family)